MAKRLFAGLGMGLLLLGLASGVHASDASFSINSVNFYGNSYSLPQSLGYVFTPQTDIIVSSLGFLDYSGNGLKDSHEVGIFDSTGTLMSSAVVASGTGSQLNNRFRYTQITPVTLRAGENYTIAALLLTQADIIGYADVSGVTVNPAISLGSFPARYVLQTGTGLQFPTQTQWHRARCFMVPTLRSLVLLLPFLRSQQRA